MEDRKETSVPEAHLRKRTKILICVAAIVVFAIALVFYGFWVDFQAYYLGVMKNLNNS